MNGAHASRQIGNQRLWAQAFISNSSEPPAFSEPADPHFACSGDARADLDSQPAADYLTAGEGPHKGEETRTSENRQPGGTGGGRAVLPVTLGRSPEVHVAGPHWGHSQEEGGGPRKRPPALGIAWLSAFLLLERAWAPQGASYKCSSDPAGLGQGLRVHF